MFISQFMYFTLISFSTIAQDVLKCNIDAAIFNDLNSLGTCICIQDHCGHIIKAAAKWYEGNHLP